MSGDTLVNADTGELIAECTPDEARELTDRICTGLGVVWELVLEAYRTRAWAALGHGSWDAYCAAEFGRFHMRLPSEERDEVIGSLRSAGLSIRAIASTGVASKKTVERTIAASGVANGDTSTLGSDGKTYDATSRAKARRDTEPEPEAPSKCSDGFDCPATPGPDGLCAWHRGKRAAETAAEGSPPPSAAAPEDSPADPPVLVPGQTPSEEPVATAPDAGAEPVGGGDGMARPAPAALPDDWRDVICRCLAVTRLDPDLLREAINGDDRADLTEARNHLNLVLKES